MIDHRDVRVRVLMEPQDIREVHIVDEAAVGQQHIFLGAVLNKIDIMVEIFQIALTGIIVRRRCRQVGKTVVTACQVPILTGADVIQHRAGPVRQHDTHRNDTGIHHAGKRKVQHTIPSRKWQGFHRTGIGQLADQAVIFLKIDNPHYRFQCSTPRSLFC